MVFNEHTMQEHLPLATYKSLRKTIRDGKELNLDVANTVAHAMKEWAIGKGATHYTHWFQPLTGITSEKHDSFLDPRPDGRAIMSFSGKELIQGEPDASSFPSGGLRATFEARGYTAWDPTSFAFIKDEVLCIPTAFCSYTGEALDKKTPLLRSMNVIECQAKRVLALFGEYPKRVIPTVGAEQEYFLISEKDYEKRQDLLLTGRTLFGYPPCKGQEMEEHYFGAIRPTVNEFMKELDDELWSLGVSAKTKHNEVAPAQHELAPIFTNANRAIDENLITMEKMKLLASRFGLVCLQHEKPFAGINGSGKHNNWSLAADKVNLLDPGDTPMDNLRFLVFLAGIIQAVDDYQEILRMSVASAGNDLRLGADEAPPATISIFLGDELTEIVETIVTHHENDYSNVEKVAMDLGVAVLPNFLKDNTDRNRTSPFAFTGNKFEFRMPGASTNLSDSTMILNTAVAKSLKEFADTMERESDKSFEKAAAEYLRESLERHKRILFGGDGYSAEWEEEAARRGLKNLRNTAEALPWFVEKKSIELFKTMGVMDQAEVESRYEVKVEKYNKTLNIETRVMKRMARRTILPAVNQYCGKLARDIVSIKKAAPEASITHQEEQLKTLLDGVDRASEILVELDTVHQRVRVMEDEQAKADAYANEVIPVMEKLRYEIDGLEKLTDRENWPMPTYNEILFYA